MAQLAWTLRQDPRIEALRVSIDGDPVPLPGGVSAYRVDGGAEYDPGRLPGEPAALRPARRAARPPATGGTLDAGRAGRSARTDLGLRSVGVEPRRPTRPPAVTDDGHGRWSSAPVSGSDDDRARTVVTGARDLLRPGVGLRRPDVAGRPHRATAPWSRASRTARARDRRRPRHHRRAGAQLRGLARRHPPGRRRPPRRAATSWWSAGSPTTATAGCSGRRPARPISDAPGQRPPGPRRSPGATTTSLVVLSPFGASDSLVQLRTRLGRRLAGLGRQPRPTVEGALRALVGSPARTSRSTASTPESWSTCPRADRRDRAARRRHDGDHLRRLTPR